MDEVRGGGSYLSQNDLRLHFGLGAASKIDSVEIRWPNGNIESFQNVAADALHKREAEFKYDQEHMFFDQEHQVEARENQGNESHTSDRVAGMLEAGSSEEDRTTQNMAQAGLPSEGAVQRTANPPASESAAAKRYQRFANDILASSYNDLGVMRAQESNFAEAAEFFKRASACKAELAGLDGIGGSPLIGHSSIRRRSRH
jgi:hypothetical protein